MTDNPTHTPLPCLIEVERDEEGRVLICTGCGTVETVRSIKSRSATAFTCCPERKMVPAWNTRAVNSHHDLIKALRCALSAMAWIGDNCDERAATRHADDAYDSIVEAFPGLTAMLTKAEAGHG